ncbi:MAG: NADH-quinone oxidoreductase subunit N [Acidimicrobiia bacterium]|nr:NADH-quinone oxidoreductase subunit N [Acidimicrobiia bacterium]
MTDLVWSAIAPELILVTAACTLLLVDVFVKPPLRSLGWITAAALVGVVASVVIQLDNLLELRAAGDSSISLGFGGMIIVDGGALLLRAALTGVLVLAVLAAWQMLQQIGRRAAETLALMFLATAGFMLLGASANLVMMFIGLEVGSISLYVLAGMTRESLMADEAALKYFLLGSFASAVFIYGVALLYAGTGSVSIAAVDAAFTGQILTRPGVLYLALALLAAGLLFKVTAAPFHAWAPDVYQGSPAGVVGFMAASAKLGGFAGLLRLTTITFDRFIGDWQPALAALAAVSIVLGTLLAIAQSDLRRMLAYSGIAHAGFILIGVASGSAAADTVIFYLAVYTIQLVAAFAITAMVSGPTSSGSALESYSGLARRSPLIAGVLALMMIGMSGMPVTSGFIAKFGVFRAGWEADLRWVVIVALVASVAAFFFYLRVIVDMYMREPVPAEAPGTPRVAPEAGVAGSVALWVAATVTVLAGVYPGPLLELIRNALP